MSGSKASCNRHFLATDELTVNPSDLSENERASAKYLRLLFVRPTLIIYRLVDVVEEAKLVVYRLRYINVATKSKEALSQVDTIRWSNFIKHT